MQILMEAVEEARDAIENLHVVSSLLVRGGQPDAHGVRCLKNLGIRTLVNLRQSSDGLLALFKSSRREDPEVVEERESALELGMNYINLPLDGISVPSPEYIAQFFDLLRSPDHPPVYVHCLHGRDRTGLMVALYRVAFESWPVKEAYDEMVVHGFDLGRTDLAAVLLSYKSTT